MDIQRACKILEIDLDSSPERIKSAYLALVEVWHPDRFGKSPELCEIATEKLKDLNVAHDTLRAYCAARKGRRMVSGGLGANRPAPKNSHVLVRCVECLSMNRVFCFSPGLTCAHCGAKLSLRGKHSAYRPDGRIPCGDDACLGVIGDDGLCTLCGLTLKQSSQRFGIKPQKAHNYIPRRIIASVLVTLALVLGMVSGLSTIKGATAHGVKPAYSAPIPKALPKLPALALKPTSRPEIDELLQTTFMDTSLLSKQSVRAYQRNLRILGYYQGLIDGLCGAATNQGLRQFMIDYRLPKFKLTPEGLLRTLEAQVAIQDIHHDWTQMHKDGSFKNWLAALKPAERQKAQQFIIWDQVDKLVAMLKKYKRNARLALTRSVKTATN